MSEFKVADYFGAHGGAADDSTDCTAAVQAALDDIDSTNNNGTLLFPSGVCRMTGASDVDVNFALSGSEQGMVIIKGTGDSAIRFTGSQFIRMNIQGNLTIKMQDLVFLGDLSGGGNNLEAVSHHVRLHGDKVILDNVQAYGLGGGTNGDGIFGLFGGRETSVEHCNFHGNWPNLGPVIKSSGIDNFSLRSCNFIDYGAYNATSYSKMGDGGPYWVDINNTGLAGQMKWSRCHFEDNWFDEGSQTAPVRVTDFELVNMERCYSNVSGFGHGYEFVRCHSVTVEDTLAGYSAIADLVGIKATDIDLLKLRNVRFWPGDDVLGHGPTTLQLTGTTRKVIIEHCSQGPVDDRQPFTIVNTAGAELVIDGVVEKSSHVQIG